MNRNRHKMIKQTGDSLLLSKHSIQLSALFLLLSGQMLQTFFGIQIFYKHTVSILLATMHHRSHLFLCVFSTIVPCFFSERSTIRPFSTTTMTDSTTSSVTDDKEKEGSRSRNARHVQKRSPKRQQKSAKVGLNLWSFQARDFSNSLSACRTSGASKNTYYWSFFVCS